MLRAEGSADRTAGFSGGMEMPQFRNPTERTIRDNLEEVRTGIGRAALNAGLGPDSVTLVAVTKNRPAELVDMLVDMGIRHIGENRVQEAERKIARAGRRADWHLIGHLQTNKVRKALEIFAAVHSLDSLRLARAIDAEAAARTPPARVPVFIQVNVSGEASKTGVRPGEVEAMAREVSAMPGLDWAGLMTMAPYAERPEDSRPVFAELRRIRDRLSAMGLGKRDLGLSMGMSGDYMVAVEEGATVLRIGSALFKGLDSA